MRRFPERSSSSSRCLRSARHGAVALEFAILSIPFFMWMLAIFEISYDMFTQSALDDALHVAVRSIQTGNAQYLLNGQTFISNYLCPAANGRLICANLYVSVSPANFTATVKDYHDLTTGGLPVSGNTLNLTSYTAATSFCNASPQQFLLVSAVYVGPTFLSGLLPGLFTVQYLGKTVHATLATTGIVTEPYTKGSLPNGQATAAASC
jgi:Flp pilus assembly protein TadG